MVPRGPRGPPVLKVALVKMAWMARSAHRVPQGRLVPREIQAIRAPQEQTVLMSDRTGGTDRPHRGRRAPG